MPIDTLISFAESEGGSQCFGADAAKNIAAHAKEDQAAGAKYCDCPGLRSRSRDSGKERKSSLKQTEPTSARHSFYSLKQQDMRLSIE